VRKEIKTEKVPERTDQEYDNSTETKLQKMYACIQQLDETGRLIILMVLDQVSYPEIAAITGITEDTLRVKIHRIKKALTNCVQL
jgi:DNA-directed RNA polymerase specialized sigma24 family protein